jgi:hypothetical protein
VCYRITDFRYDFDTFITGYGRRTTPFRVHEMGTLDALLTNRVQEPRNYDNPAALAPRFSI